jgi:hypothetical protein
LASRFALGRVQPAAALFLRSARRPLDARCFPGICREFGASSKFNAEWEFLTLLRDEGRRATGEFLDMNADHLGKCSTANLDVLLQEC